MLQSLRKGGVGLRHKVCAGLCVLSLLFTISGCSSLFERTYTSESDFKGSEEIELDDDTEIIKSYSALRWRIYDMVTNHEETAEFLISGYSGDVTSDIASICGSVNTESAYGAYCVEYVSYDLTQIVSYYEAKVQITYKYTAEELEDMLVVSNNENFSDTVAEKMADGLEHMVFKVNIGKGDEKTVAELVRQSCRNHPTLISYIPTVSAKVYSGNTSQMIYDIRVNYGPQWESNSSRTYLLINALTNAKRNVPASSQPWMVINGAQYLAENCGVSDEGGSTAYDAMVIGLADSEGIASAFKALCDRLEISCQVISGMMDKSPHYWNLVQINGDYYHIDVSELLEKGGEDALFLNDSEKSATCWWNLTDYPACEGELTYRSIVSPGAES